MPAPTLRSQERTSGSSAWLLAGNYAPGTQGRRSAQPPVAQLISSLVLLQDLLERYDLTPAQVRGHNEVASGTLCPGRGISLQTLRAALR